MSAPMDLTQAPDHPAKILSRTQVDERLSHTERYGHKKAATLLREYETDSNVTFAALDNDALMAVREAYAETRLDRGIGGLSGDAWSDLADAVAGLLGLDPQ